MIFRILVRTNKKILKERKIIYNLKKYHKQLAKYICFNRKKGELLLKLLHKILRQLVNLIPKWILI